MDIVENQRVSNDFIYMMLYSAADNDVYAREHYHKELATSVLNYLHIRADDPTDPIASCMRLVAKVDATAPQKFEAEKLHAQAWTNEYIYHMWHDCCCAIKAHMVRIDDSQETIQKTAMDALLFISLHLHPPFLNWLLESDPAVRPTDVAVLDKVWLQIFTGRDVREAISQLVNGVMTLETAVAHLRGTYVMLIGVYNPSVNTEDESDMMPDIPDDFCIDV